METTGKKRIWATFLFEFKILCKAVETTHNINNTFNQELLMNVQCSGGSRSFAKEKKDLKMRSTVASYQKLTITKSIIKADPLITTWDVAKELNFDHSVICHLKKIGKVKKLNKWVPHELIKNQRNHHFEVSFSFILWNNNEPFLDWTVTCDERQPATTSSVVGPRSSKALPKARLHPKKVIVPVWWSAACLIHHSFLKPSETKKYAQQIEKRHWKP